MTEKFIVFDFYNQTLDVYQATPDMANKSTDRILEELGFNPDNVQINFVADDFTVIIH